MNRYLKAAKQAKKEASLWAYAAWTLPFIALAIIIFEHFVGWDGFIGKTIIVISVSFFSISVFWWWWALNKFVKILEAFREAEDSFLDMKNELRETRKLIQDDLDNR